MNKTDKNSYFWGADIWRRRGQIKNKYIVSGSDREENEEEQKIAVGLISKGSWKKMLLSKDLNDLLCRMKNVS